MSTTLHGSLSDETLWPEIKLGKPTTRSLRCESSATHTKSTKIPGKQVPWCVAERRGEEAQRPLQLLSTPDSGAERLLATEEWQASTTSSQKAGEPSLLGSGWSWQNPKDVQDFLTTSSLNNTADSETLRRKMSISSVRTGQTSEDTRYVLEGHTL